MKIDGTLLTLCAFLPTTTAFAPALFKGFKTSSALGAGEGSSYSFSDLKTSYYTDTDASETKVNGDYSYGTNGVVDISPKSDSYTVR
jgi:hypothetical protein